MFLEIGNKQHLILDCRSCNVFTDPTLHWKNDRKATNPFLCWG